MMIETEAQNRLEARLAQLIDGMLAGKESEIEFLIGLNRLDDILIEAKQDRPVTQELIRFLGDYRHWLTDDALAGAQKKRLGFILRDLAEELLSHDDADNLKLAEEVKEWLKSFGGGAFRLTLKASREQASLADRFCALLQREADEMNMLLAERDHLLTCLDDLLDSARHKPDTMYRHLAASLIYFLKAEGYKVDPYVKMLRETNPKEQAG